jgi:hypothetical protein
MELSYIQVRKFRRVKLKSFCQILVKLAIFKCHENKIACAGVTPVRGKRTKRPNKGAQLYKSTCRLGRNIE